MWVSECWCSCYSMCSCVLGCMLACWTPCFSHEQLSFHCLQHVFRGHGNTGLFKHGDPVLPHFFSN